jgi:hypothetical protein
VLLRANPFYRAQREIIDGTFHHLCLVVPLVLAFFAGCGLFAGEVDWGTAPVLFGLPVSRRRIWAAKVLAGLALTAVGSLIALALVRLFLPSVFRAAPFSAYLPDVALWTAFAFAVSVFCSTITRHANAALALAAIVAGALATGAIALWYYLDAPLLGYTEPLDIALWCFSAVPALLLASALVVTRGELFQSRRIWAIAFPTLLITIGLTVLLVSGAARWLTRYDRSHVEDVWVLRAQGRFVEVITLADPIPWVREFREGWMPRPKWRWGGVEHIHRANYGAILDLDTGKEVLVHRTDSHDSPSFRAALSPDGRLAAVIARPSGLTWGARSRYRHLEREWTLEVWDLQSGKRLYSGVPEAMASRPFDVHRVAWSPSAEHLALPVRDHPTTLYVVHPDGSGLTRLSPRFESWKWAADDELIYGLDGDAVLYRAYPDDRAAEVVSRLADELHSDPDALRWMWEPSPDGRWLLMHEEFHVEPADVDGVGERRIARSLWAVPTDGSEALELWTSGPEHGADMRFVRSSAWTADEEALYLAVYDSEEKSSSVLRWTAGEPSPVTVVSGLAGYLDLLTRPDSGDIVIWRWRRGGPGKPWYQATEGAVLVLDGEGQVRELASRGVTAELATLYRPEGFDTKGRLLLSPRDDRAEKQGIHALDLDTGEVRQIYP